MMSSYKVSMLFLIIFMLIKYLADPQESEGGQPGRPSYRESSDRSLWGGSNYPGRTGGPHDRRAQRVSENVRDIIYKIKMRN